MALFQVQALLGKRKTGYGSGGAYEYLVKWKDAPLDDSTWEVTRNLQSAKSAVKLYERLNELEDGGRIELLYDRLPSYQAGTRHNLVNSGFSMHLQAQIRKEKFESENNCQKVDKREEEKKYSKDPILLLGMNKENGKLWFYYEKMGIRGWTSREYLLRNYPNQLLDFYLNNVRTVESLDSQSQNSFISIGQQQVEED